MGNNIEPLVPYSPQDHPQNSISVYAQNATMPMPVPSTQESSPHWNGDKVDEFVSKIKEISERAIDLSLLNQENKQQISNIKETHQAVKPAIAIASKNGEAIDDIEVEQPRQKLLQGFKQSPKAKIPHCDDIEVNDTPRRTPELSNIEVLTPTHVYPVNCFDNPQVNSAASMIFQKLKLNSMTPTQRKSTEKYNKTLFSQTDNKLINQKKAYKIVKESKIEYKIVDRKKLTIMYEGMMLKYRPGFSMRFVDRYVILTRTHFIYYSSVWEAHCFSRPMLSIPLKEIQSIECIRSMDTHNEMYEFEIYLKQNKDPASTEFKLASPAYIKSEDYVITPSSKQSILQFASPMENQSKIGNRNSGIQRSYINSRIVKGHLMLSPEKHILNYSFNENNEGVEETKHYKIYDGIKFNAGEVSDYQQFISKQKGQILKIKNKEPTFSKAPKSWMLNFKGNETWANREIEWFMAESRLCFALKTEHERDKWVCLINYLSSLQS